MAASRAALLAEQLRLKEKLAIQRARTHFLSFIKYTMPTYEVVWFHRVLANALQRVADGTCRRLIVTVPPRHGKSQQVSVHFPAYLLGVNPNAQILAASYNASLASRMNRSVQRVMDSKEYQAIFPKTRLNGASVRSVAGSWLRNSDEFEIVGHRGFYRSAGVCGSATGYGATCFVAGSLVETERGKVKIEDFFGASSAPMVWAYNHGTGRRQLCRVNAVSRSRCSSFVSLSFTDGGSLTCTPGHMVYSKEGGYRPAVECGPNTLLVRASRAPRRGNEGLVLHPLPEAGEQKQVPMRPLRGLRGHGARHREVWQVPQTAANAVVRIHQGAKAEGDGKVFLQSPMCAGDVQRGAGGPSNEELPGVRKEAATPQLAAILHGEILQRDVPKQGVPSAPEGNADCKMPNVQKTLRGRTRNSKVLLNAMQKPGTRTANVGEIQPGLCGGEVADRQGVCQHLQKNGSFCPETGQAQMLLLPEEGGRLKCACAPYRRKEEQQQVRQSNSVLRKLSFEEAPLAYTHPEKVEEFSDKAQWVYDLEVEECHNYFVDEVLVHNCGIIDDPTKSRLEANSATYQERVWDWYRSVFFTRLEKNASMLLVLTRWAVSDLAGKLLEQAAADSRADQWEVINFPATAEGELHPEDHRQPGEALWPEKYNAERLATIRASVGEFDWAALFQQRPAPRLGAVIRDSWWKFYDRLPDGLTDWCISADLSFKDRGDPSAFQVWACKGADRFLVDQIHGRMAFTEQIRAMRQLSAKYPQVRLKLVEDAANGAALVETLRSEIQGIVGVPPKGSKELRLDAVAPQIEAGNVYLPTPRIAPWVNEYIAEFNAFPVGAHDDMIDATSQALFRLSQSNKPKRGIRAFSSEPVKKRTIFDAI